MRDHGSKTSTVPVVCATFGFFSARSKWFLVGRVWWPRTKPVISLWTGDKATTSGVAAYRLTPPQKNPSAKICWKSSRLDFFWDQDGILLIDYLPKGQTINAEYSLSLLAQLKDILNENRRGKFTKGVLFLHNAPAHRALATQKKLACLVFQRLITTLFSGSGPFGLPPVPWTEKNNWSVAIFRPTRRSFLPRRPGWTDKFLKIFLSFLQKLEQRAKKCIELRREYVDKIPSLVAVACFLPGWAKELSAPLRKISRRASVWLCIYIALSYIRYLPTL